MTQTVPIDFFLGQFSPPRKVFIWDSPWILIRVRESLAKNNVNNFDLEFFVFKRWNHSCIFRNFFRTALVSEKQQSQQSLFWSSYFFRVPAYLKSSFSERFISLNQLFFAAYLIFRSETSTEQSFLENRKFLRQLLFGTATFLRRNYLE